MLKIKKMLFLIVLLPALAFSQSAKKYFREGNAKLDSNKYAEAEALFTQAINLDPKFEKAYLKRARSRISTGDKKGAIADYTTVINMDPNTTDAYRERGLLDPAYAVSDNSKIIAANPKDIGAYEALARAK